MMITFLSFVLNIVLIIKLSFLRIPLLLWLTSIAIAVIASVYFPNTLFLLQLFFALLLMALLICVIKPLEQNLRSKKIFSVLKQIMPAISTTEQEVLIAHGKAIQMDDFYPAELTGEKQ